MALAIRRKRITSLDIVGREIREILKNLLFGHASGEVAEDVINSDPHATDTGLAAAFPRLNRDDVLIPHGLHSTATRTMRQAHVAAERQLQRARATALDYTKE